MCMDEAISRILSTNSSRRLGRQLHGSFHSLCVTGKFWEDGSWNYLCRDEGHVPDPSVCHSLDYGRLRERAHYQSIMSKYFSASKLSFAGTLNLRICIPVLVLSTYHRISSRMCGRWSVIIARSKFSE